MIYNLSLSFNSRDEYVEYLSAIIFSDCFKQVSILDEDIIAGAIDKNIADNIPEDEYTLYYINKIDHIIFFLESLDKKYKTTKLYVNIIQQEHHWNDFDVGIDWLLEIIDKSILKEVIDNVINFYENDICELTESRFGSNIQNYCTKEQLEKIVMYDTDLLHLVEEPSEELLNFINLHNL